MKDVENQCVEEAVRGGRVLIGQGGDQKLLLTSSLAILFFFFLRFFVYLFLERVRGGEKERKRNIDDT